jgi:hypothetical protein
MFVRWQSRKKTRLVRLGRGETGDTRWTATVVEAVRIDGKPRQKHVACLGSIYESRFASTGGRAAFWNMVTDRLDGLDDRIRPSERRAVEIAIARKVPCPTKRLRAVAVQRAKRYTADLTAGLNETWGRSRSSESPGV